MTDLERGVTPAKKKRSASDLGIPQDSPMWASLDDLLPQGVTLAQAAYLAAGQDQDDTDEQHDDFLDDATHAVADAWEATGASPLTVEDKYALNDVLTAYFEGRR